MNMRALLSLLNVAALVFAGPALAKGQSETTGYVDDVDQRCQAWAPSMLAQRDYVLRYAGGCKNGRAEGKGKAEWLYRYAELKLKAAWEGEFRNGVFLDGQPIKGTIEPAPGDRYIVAAGSVPGADVFFLSRSPQDGPMVLCQVDQVALLPGANVDVSDDTTAQRIMEAGIRIYRNVCPSSSRQTNIGIFAEPIKPRKNGMLPNPVASARHDPNADKLTSYSNSAAEKIRQAKRQAEYAQKQDEARKQFNSFSRQHSIAAWVTVQQLEENPFRWEGKTVGVIVRNERLLTRDTALVQSGFRDWSPYLQLTGITPEFPDSRRTVLLAAKVGKRERPADATEGSTATLVTVRHIDSRTCERDGCGDWLSWMSGNNDLVWGEPYVVH
jgi:hypothetical protein